MAERFSRKFGYTGAAAGIRIREEAPQDIRDAILAIAYDVGFKPGQLRTILCQVLRVAPNPGNWSEYPNIHGEVQDLLSGAPWYRVYDFVEAVFRYATEVWIEHIAENWQREINEYFLEAGVGWQLIDGSLEVREAEGFEASTRGAVEALEESGQRTASSELHEALRDLSRRPDPDVTGAIQHGMAALECVARDVTGDSKSTFGQILGKFPDAVPKPLNTALDKVWGYASDRARHVREGGAAGRDEAVLIVGLAASVSTYLARKAAGPSKVDDGL